MPRKLMRYSLPSSEEAESDEPLRLKVVVALAFRAASMTSPAGAFVGLVG
jgi:hypothetical protein